MLLTDYCENFVLAHYEDFVAFEFDFGACVFAVEHFVAGLENHFFVFGAVSDCEDCDFEGILFSGIGNDDD